MRQTNDNENIEFSGFDTINSLRRKSLNIQKDLNYNNNSYRIELEKILEKE